jgi:hypothetical protein
MTDGMKHLLAMAYMDATSQTALMSMLRVWQNYQGNEITTADATELSQLICRAEDSSPAKSPGEILRLIEETNP